MDLSLAAVLFCLASAFGAALIHGSTGLAGGLILLVLLTQVVEIKLAVSVVSCALLFSHASRIFIHINQLDWAKFGLLMSGALPTIVLGAWIFTWLSGQLVATFMAFTLLVSIPIKQWSKARQLRLKSTLLPPVGLFWGIVAGNTIGPGFLLAPFLQGAGLIKASLVSTMAAIALIVNIIKVTTFSHTGLLDTEWLALGILMGLVSIPANYLGGNVLLKMTDHQHEQIINWMTLALAYYFLYLMVTGTF
ncbi:MAG: sulfite exporter TauE/SafE family protein [Gammaproteobacteria bacterium]